MIAHRPLITLATAPSHPGGMADASKAATVQQPVLEGTLFKRSHLLRAWRRRRAVLFPSHVSLFQGQAGREGKAYTIQLSEECRIERPPDAHRQLHAFLLIGPRARVHLASESAAEAERWILLLGSCCRREMPLPPAALTIPTLDTAAVQSFWPHVEADELGRGSGGLASSPAGPPLDETETRRVLTPSQYDELCRWPQLLAVAQRALHESAAYADGRAPADWWHKLSAPSIEADVEALVSRTSLPSADGGEISRALGEASSSVAAQPPSAAQGRPASPSLWRPMVAKSRARRRMPDSPPRFLLALAVAIAARLALKLPAEMVTFTAAATLFGDMVAAASAPTAADALTFVVAVIVGGALAHFVRIALARVSRSAVGHAATRSASGALPVDTIRCRHLCTERCPQVLADCASLLPTRMAWDRSFEGGQVLCALGEHTSVAQMILRASTPHVGSFATSGVVPQATEVILLRFEATTTTGTAIHVCVSTTYGAHCQPVAGLPRVAGFEQWMVAMPLPAGGDEGSCEVLQQVRVTGFGSGTSGCGGDEAEAGAPANVATAAAPSAGDGGSLAADALDGSSSGSSAPSLATSVVSALPRLHLLKRAVANHERAPSSLGTPPPPMRKRRSGGSAVHLDERATPEATTTRSRKGGSVLDERAPSAESPDGAALAATASSATSPVAPLAPTVNVDANRWPRPWEPPAAEAAPWRSSPAHLRAYASDLSVQLHRLLRSHSGQEPSLAVSSAAQASGARLDEPTMAQERAQARTPSARADKLSGLIDEVVMDALPAVLRHLFAVFVACALTLLIGSYLLPSVSFAVHWG